ncbi:hypothetical protein H6P81_019147 [Aristolochia fimbriata]|uniref:Cyclin B1 n=1 Tax=Aristolochia fimbriata TaxID=158543 RepID=A0AAV7DR06_ARIFI|nr:hypothetical protein H6P81_019147 [Aristolochia fimbriata]
MASKPVAPRQQRGAPIVGKQQKPTQAPGSNNRRALEDIGNRGNLHRGGAEGKLQTLPQVNRPLTRAFRAQLLDNAQQVNKKTVSVATGRELGVGDGPKAAKNKNKAVKPVKEVIVISPSTSKQTKEIIKSSSSAEDQKVRKQISTTKKGQEGSSRRKVKTTTSVLLNHDIDSADAEDQLALVEYVEEIYKFYRLNEEPIQICDYMGSQVELNEKMRAILTDWLIEVHHKFELMPETLYLTVHIVDLYLSMETVRRKELQLVGVAAMLIASKYEEIWAPEVNDFICISDQAYVREQILAMEKAILNKLEWSLTVPTPYVFIVRFLKASSSDQKMEHLVFFLVELGLMQYCMIKYCPSMIAASAVYAARCTLEKCPQWSETLEHHTGYSEPQLQDCARLLVSFHSRAAESGLKSVHKKYTDPQLSGVALLPPAKKLLGKVNNSKRGVSTRNSS